MKEIVKVEETSIEIYSKEDCIININQSKENLSEWVYKAYKLGEDDFADVIKACEIGERTAYNYIKYEEAIEVLKPVANLTKTETSLSLSQGIYCHLKGNTPQEREQNFQEVFTAIDRLPASYEIEVYNSLKSHAQNGEDLQKVDEILRYIVTASSSVKRKFRGSSSAPYTLKKLLGAIQAEADESVIIGLADTGNLIATKSSKADREEIANLKNEIEVLNNRLNLFESFLAKKRVKQLMDQMDYTIRAYKKMGGDKKILDALKLLSLEINVSEYELKAAYRKEVSIHHPDKGGDEVLFIKIVEANQTIKNHIKRMTK